MELPLEIVWKKSRRRQAVQVRSLLCYGANSKLSMHKTEIAICLGLSQPAVSIAARRGKEIAG